MRFITFLFTKLVKKNVFLEETMIIIITIEESRQCKLIEFATERIAAETSARAALLIRQVIAQEVAAAPSNAPAAPATVR